MKDPPLLGTFLSLPLAFIAKKELFKNFWLGFLISLASTIPVDRELAETKTFRLAKKSLASKAFNYYAWQLGIFIEGTRSKIPGQLAKPNKGPIFIAKLAKTKILPIGISYRGKKEIIVKIGKAYSIDPKAELEDQAWLCLEKISELCDYSMPPRHSAD